RGNFRWSDEMRRDRKEHPRRICRIEKQSPLHPHNGYDQIPVFHERWLAPIPSIWKWAIQLNPLLVL
ncbi:hypothetical protein A2U01_0059003, partial [Trifolium medium]|nr:hypothetical protein [Trifolium medium]